MIGSVALMLEKSFDMPEAANRIWAAMRQVFGAGYTTVDLGDPKGGGKILNTSEFGDKVVEALQS